MFRALVVASALLTATLAAVLFMPGIGRNSGAAEAVSTGEMLRSGELASGAEDVAAEPVEAAAVMPEPEVQPLEVAEVATAAAEKQGPLADENALAAAVALSAPAIEDTTPGASGDVEALSRGVLAGLGHELPEEQPAADVASTPDPEAMGGPLVNVERSTKSRASSDRALRDAASWTTDYVLIGLGQGPRKVTSALEDAQEWSTAYVLNGLGAEFSQEADAGNGAGPVVALEDVIAQAIEEGRSDEDLIELIDRLSASGQLDAPAALLRPDGQVDSALVLNALVSASTARAGAEAGARQQAANGAAAAAPTPVQRPVVRQLESPVTYTVKRGDSLAAIAYRFYGVTSRYTMIFEANREALLSPDKIRAGQRLTIPAG
ncbi:LysM peptidoglycan-binding domain-containing protein [Oceanicola sp. D3]|uniref:LysM peptidoglycan-binding domain-containing protein n=1 Tax=Oceanicola sp. D3 TaxID=2587163 RepID=UPI001AEF7FE6|nr:LysM peptidoglycan-binding domain-containing protein [Oceanicola sp. D3]